VVLRFRFFFFFFLGAELIEMGQYVLWFKYSKRE